MTRAARRTRRKAATEEVKEEVKETKKVETKAAPPVGQVINRQKLLDALTKVKPGVANKEIVETSINFSFNEKEIFTNNDEISVAQKFNSGITGSIKAAEFYKLISKIPSEEITISQEGSDLLLTAEIKSKDKDDKEIIDNLEAKIKMTEAIIDRKGIDPPAKNSKKWNKLPEDFTKAATFCIFSCSKNMVKPELTCIWFTQDEDGAVAISCDGYRGTMYYFDKTDEIHVPFLVPANVAKYLPIYNPIRYLLTDSWLHLMNNEDTVLSCRVVATDYPEQIWDFFDVTGSQLDLPQGFGDVIQRTETIVTEEFEQDRFLTLSLRKGEIECTGQGTLGKISEKRPFDYDGEEMQILVHPRLLLDILKHHSAMRIGERLKFEGEYFEHVVCMPEK